MQWRFVLQAATAAVFLTVSSASAADPGVGLVPRTQSLGSPTDDLFVWLYLKVVNKDSVVERRPVTTGPEQAGGLQVVFPTKMVRTAKGLRTARGCMLLDAVR